MKNRILIVDDDEEMCEELSEVLTDEGYIISCVNNGLEGKKHIDHGNYDVILLDIKLPGLTGYDILKTTKKDPEKCKILVLTGRPMTKESFNTKNHKEDEEENVLKLADAVISKPFDVQKILDTIKQFTC